ncbi:hypothetical protein [Pediococcus claussenii]|nr:hypothetical protein [Pediococcus claussenii]ANZ69355.1 hypothetical protein AYR57_03120 [Pediococcus claussenii]ANZ71175.1 hypothetical protein AYR58_03135 [Pediococcus claussenii]KRN20466.1 hypothetical protein IV79_GL000521 [Pediococcus claussenii]
MEFEQRLPQSFRETILFMLIISILSVNIIAPVITGFEVGFSVHNWLLVLHQVPLLWVVIIILTTLTQGPATKLSSWFLDENSNFRSTMLITAICNVFLMSLVLTIVGSWIGTSNISMKPVTQFFYKWPRNFTIALIVEAFIAQPIARYVISVLHKNKQSENI